MMIHCKHSIPTEEIGCRQCKLDKSLHYGPYSCYCIFYELSLWNRFVEWIYDVWQKVKRMINDIVQ